jgi:hypothetical protein
MFLIISMAREREWKRARGSEGEDQGETIGIEKIIEKYRQMSSGREK